MSQSSTRVARTNNSPTTEMYMALFELTLIDSFVTVDLSLEEVGDRWMYKSPITTQMYDLFIAGHMQANEDMERMGENKTTFQEMWEMSGNLTDIYIKRHQRTPPRSS